MEDPINLNLAPFAIDNRKLFKLPWNKTDNAMTWLEPTRKCNITCDACFAVNDPDSEKTLAQIKEEIETLLRLRRCDSMIIAGGEPLTHPGIVEITSIVRSHNVKPMIFTNGVGLERPLLKELKAAGAHGFTFHVDSHQSRPDWEGKNEIELNELREYYADMVFREGKLVCSFNATIFPDTLSYIPDLIKWVRKNVARVQVFTLIAVRMMEINGAFEYYVGNKKIDISEMAYASEEAIKELSAMDIFQELKKSLPEFDLCAYLGGTVIPDSIKWSIGCWVGTKKFAFGCMGPKTMEFLQNLHHLVKGTYLAYTKPSLNRKARLMFLFGLFDPVLRKAWKKYMGTALKKPGLFFKRLYSQTINILQPVDVLPSGETNFCDGCPNLTLWQDKLVTSCRLGDYIKYGAPVRIVQKER